MTETIPEQLIVRTLNYLRLPASFRSRWKVRQGITPEPAAVISVSEDRVSVTYSWNLSDLKDDSQKE